MTSIWIDRAKAIFLAALALLAFPALSATYTASSTTYAWETAANAYSNTNFIKTCSANTVDDDRISLTFPGGFTFPFNGVNTTSALLFSNGQIQVGADTGAFRTYTNTALPEGNSSNQGGGCPSNQAAINLISPAWEDWNPNTGGNIKWELKGTAPNRYLVVMWNAVNVYSTSNKGTFEAILYENGNIKFQYNALTGTTWATLKPTVGVQVNSTDYTQWGAVPANGTAILFTPNKLTSFGFTGTGTASTCSPQTIVVTAKNAAGTTLTTYTGTVSLSTSTAHGTWALSSGSGTFTAGAADSGAATYVFSAADNGVATFTLSDPRAETLTASFNDSTAAVSSTSASIVYSDNAFVIAPTDALGLQVVSGRPHAFSASFFRKDPSTGNCSVATGYTGSKSLDFWTSNSGSHPGAATAPSISSASTCASPAALASSAPAVNAASNTISLSFASGVASFYLCTSDVGQYAINARDDTLGYAGVAVTGASSTATARPFALIMDTIQSGATVNPGGTASAGAKFIPAQTAFSARITAKNWASGQDTLVAGTPDPTANLSANATTARFAAATTVAASAHTPSLGILGTLSGGAVASASFASGSATATPLSYSEAGSIKLTATSNNYLGSGFNIPGITTGNVGRFHAASFAQSGATASPSCASGSFTYMAQNFPLATTLQAVGSSGGFLLNYDQAKGYGFLATPTWRAVDALNGVDLGTRLSTGTAPTWTLGAWSYNSTAVQFNRLANPDGQYDQLQIGLSAVDADGAAIAGMDMSYTASGTCLPAACNAKTVGTTQKMRFGRLDLSNAYGSILTTLRSEAKAQYWTKSATGTALGWSQNTLDSCTSIPYASMGLGGYLGSVSSATLPAGSLTLSSGKGTIVVTRPAGATVSGSVHLGINLGAAAASPNSCLSGLPSVAASATALSHLQSNHCSASNFNLNPNARLTWGSASGKSGATVFIRETY